MPVRFIQQFLKSVCKDDRALYLHPEGEDSQLFIPDFSVAKATVTEISWYSRVQQLNLTYNSDTSLSYQIRLFYLHSSSLPYEDL